MFEPDLDPLHRRLARDPLQLGQRPLDVLHGEVGEDLEPVGCLGCQREQRVVVQHGEVAADLGGQGVVEVGRRCGHHLPVHPGRVHVGQPLLDVEHAGRQRTALATGAVGEVVAVLPLGQRGGVIGVRILHGRDHVPRDRVGVQVDRGHAEGSSGRPDSGRLRAAVVSETGCRSADHRCATSSSAAAGAQDR